MSSNKYNNQKTKASQLFEALNAESVVSNAQKIVTAAVNVLEEEIAAGILAAKKIETKIIDVHSIREDPQNLMNKIRKDVHEAVDLLMDSITALSQQFDSFSQVVTTQRKEEKDENTKASAIPVVRNVKPICAGETLTLQMEMGNYNKQELEIIKFQKTDLSSSGGHKISSRSIKIDPVEMQLAPGAKGEISIQIKIPSKISIGQYCALFVDANNADNKAIIQVDIT